MNDVSGALAIEGGTPIRLGTIQPLWHVSDDTRRHIMEILDSGRLAEWRGGPVCRRFEAQFAASVGANYAVAVNSGTSALHVAVVAAGIGPGDEAIVPTAAYVSAASVLVQERATPVMCDIDQDTYTIDVQRLESCITSRTRAILPVHFWGCPADMTSICEIAEEHGLIVIEDCGQSHGSTVGHETTGAIGDFGCFSFAPRKHITTGQGGMVACRTERDATKVRELVNKGKSEGWLDYRSLGYGYGMGEIAAAIGLDGLRVLDESVRRRRAAAAIYHGILSDTPFRIPADPPWGRHVYFKVPMLLPASLAQQRDYIVAAISAENISCRPPHPPMHSIDWLRAYAVEVGHPYDASSYPVSERILPRMMELESGPNMTDDDVEVSALAVLKVWNALR